MRAEANTAPPSNGGGHVGRAHRGPALAAPAGAHQHQVSDGFVVDRVAKVILVATAKADANAVMQVQLGHAHDVDRTWTWAGGYAKV